MQEEAPVGPHPDKKEQKTPIGLRTCLGGAHVGRLWRAEGPQGGLHIIEPLLLVP